MSGRAKRRLYKPERAPARTKGVLEKQAPISCPNASRAEITMALFAMCRMANVIIGRGAEYDPLRDEYTLIGKSLVTGKAQEVKVQGAEIGNLIQVARILNGGRMGRARQSATAPAVAP